MEEAIKKWDLPRNARKIMSEEEKEEAHKKSKENILNMLNRKKEEEEQQQEREREREKRRLRLTPKNNRPK